MVAMMGTVEKEEPIPMVISRPTSSIRKAASPCDLPSCWRRTAPDSPPRGSPFMTAAKPAAEIMMKPMRDIMHTPWVKASWLSRNLMTPPQVKMMKTAERPQHDAVGHQLQAECHGDGQQGYPDVVEGELDRLKFGGQDLLQIILTRLAVAEEDGDEQAEEHAEYRDGHRQGSWLNSTGTPLSTRFLARMLFRKIPPKPTGSSR